VNDFFHAISRLLTTVGSALNRLVSYAIPFLHTWMGKVLCLFLPLLGGAWLLIKLAAAGLNSAGERLAAFVQAQQQTNALLNNSWYSTLYDAFCFGNYLLPFDDLFLAISALYIFQGMVFAYRFIKSWIPGLS